MTRSDTFPLAQRPLTEDRLADELRDLGVAAGQLLLVHASLSSLGRVAGGAPAVLRALRAVVGPDGTVVAPTGTEWNSRSSRNHLARLAGLTAEEAAAVERSMPPFAAGSTPSAMGAVSEAVRSAADAVRSTHPQSSFAAVGPRAAWLMARHPLRCHLGPSSPLGKLAARRAQVLMLGVGYGAFSGFHLAEYTYRPDPPLQTYECVLAGARGMPRWTRFTDVVLDDRPFEAIGAAMEAAQAGDPWVRHGQVGAARCRLLPLRPAVEFAEQWLRENRVPAGRRDAAPR